MIVALAERVVAKYQASLREFVDGMSEKNRPKQLLSYLFPDEPVDSTDDVLVVESLIAAGDKYPDVRQLMFGYVDDLVGDVSKQLRLAFPEAGKSKCWAVAYGIVSICFNQESLSPMNLPPKYLKAARVSSEALIQSLES